MNPSQAAAQAGAENADRVFNTLQSLRRSFIRIAGVVLIGSVAGYYLAEPVLRHLRDLTGVKLAAYGTPETFFTFLTLALALGVFASFPYILYAILAGIQQLFPSLTHRVVRAFCLASVVLFYTGVLFCLKISLPYGVQFLLEFEGHNIEAIITVDKFAA